MNLTIAKNDSTLNEISVKLKEIFSFRCLVFLHSHDSAQVNIFDAFKGGCMSALWGNSD